MFLATDVSISTLDPLVSLKRVHDVAMRKIRTIENIGKYWEIYRKYHTFSAIFDINLRGN